MSQLSFLNPTNRFKRQFLNGKSQSLKIIEKIYQNPHKKPPITSNSLRIQVNPP